MEVDVFPMELVLSFSIEQVSQLPPESIVQFLQEQQGTPANHTLWKYYDEQFNAGRPRGFAAVQDDRVVGLLGLIPFKAALKGEVFDTAWTCDWFVDAERASGATGIALLKAATGSFDTLYHTGGGEVTKQLFGRLASVSENDAVREYRILLRLGYLLNRARQRNAWLAKLPIDGLKNLPLRRLVRADATLSATFRPGVSDGLLRPSPESNFDTDFHPVYDAEHLRWFARNPDLESYSCTTNHGASALLWHPHQDHPRQTATQWRLAIFQGEASSPELEALVLDATGFARDKGADSVKILVSRHDRELSEAIESAQYTSFKDVPFFAFYQNADAMPSESMSGHSFLDADNATLY